MITAKELNPHNYPTTPEQDKNLALLHEKMNKLRAIWGKPMIVTSGLRSEADQVRINPKALKSKHLKGQACDIRDSGGELSTWCLKNVHILEDIGLWVEHPNYTRGWTHFQIVPPRSGHRFFIP